MLQYMCKNRIFICGISKPYRTQGTGTCAVSEDGKYAILLLLGKHEYKWQMIKRGIGYVIVEINGVILVSCYYSPNISYREFIIYTSVLEIDLRRYINDKVVLFGDFNAGSVVWDDRINSVRGDYLCDLLNALEFKLCNNIGKTTCNRVQGDSVIDLTLVSKKLRKQITDWQICDTEIWSDVMIKFMLKNKHKCIKKKFEKYCNNKTWSKNINSDKFQAVLEAFLWCQNSFDIDNINCDEAVNLFNKKVSYVCDQYLPKYCITERENVYWWCNKIAELRSDANKKRRVWMGGRVKNNNVRKIAILRCEYTFARKLLRSAIRRTKNNCWKELIQDIDNDPWGKPCTRSL